MQIWKNPERSEWKKICTRPYTGVTDVLENVKSIMEEVKHRGDEALREFANRFDGYTPETFELSSEEISAGAAELPESLKSAINLAYRNILSFHQAYDKRESGEVITTTTGAECWKKSLPIQKVGLYIPGGTAPLFSTVLMLGVPASLAGCKEVILCTPPDKEGKIHPAILYAAQLTGITRVFRLGGAQAVAAMTYGTTSLPQVYKIFGPGNQFVTAAKQLAQLEGVAIDMPAGPSEVCVLADESASPAFIASDLLSQAEHGSDSHVLFITTSEKLINEVKEQVLIQTEMLNRQSFTDQAMAKSSAVFLGDMNDAIALANNYAPEHLIINTKDADDIALQVTEAGSVFIGPFSPETAGDYASGTNHVLPTNGAARAWSGVSVNSFLRTMSFQKLSADGLKQMAPVLIEMAEAEGLEAHANAVKMRFKN